MKKNRFSLVLASVLVLALVLSACSMNIPALGISIDGTPVPALRIDINPASASTATATVDPLAATATGCSTPCGATATPTATATICPTNGNCPIATHLGSSSNMILNAVAGHTYHVNISVSGAQAGIETNQMFTALTNFSMTFDGSAWEYPQTITDGNCQICSETAGDTWVSNIPALNGLVEVHNPPCAGQAIVDWSNTMIVKSVSTQTTTATPAAAITNGVIIAGGDGTTTISGICPTGAYCGLTYWIPGETGIQHKVVIVASSDVVVAGFRGTLVSWNHQPALQEVGIDAKNLATTVADATTTGITFTGDFKEVTIK